MLTQGPLNARHTPSHPTPEVQERAPHSRVGQQPRPECGRLSRGGVPVPSVLLRALEPTTGLALWRRPTRVALHRATLAALTLEPFCLVAEGTPDQAPRNLLRGLPSATRPLGEDMALLGRLFTTL